MQIMTFQFGLLTTGLRQVMRSTVYSPPIIAFVIVGCEWGTLSCISVLVNCFQCGLLLWCFPEMFSLQVSSTTDLVFVIIYISSDHIKRQTIMLCHYCNKQDDFLLTFIKTFFFWSCSNSSDYGTVRFTLGVLQVHSTPLVSLGFDNHSHTLT